MPNQKLLCFLFDLWKSCKIFERNGLWQVVNFQCRSKWAIDGDNMVLQNLCSILHRNHEYRWGSILLEGDWECNEWIQRIYRCFDWRAFCDYLVHAAVDKKIQVGDDRSST